MSKRFVLVLVSVAAVAAFLIAGILLLAAWKAPAGPGADVLGWREMFAILVAAPVVMACLVVWGCLYYVKWDK